MDRKEAAVRAAQALLKKKQEQEDASRAAAAEEKAASARAAAAEKVHEEQAQALKVKAEEERVARETRDAEERKAVQIKEETDKKAAATHATGGLNDEWTGWVDTQTRLKKEVIEVVKADQTVKTGLRSRMRLITRGLGQVINTKDSILRVVCHVVERIFPVTDRSTDQ